MGNLISISISCDKIFSDCQKCIIGRSAYIHDLQDNLVALNTASKTLLELKNDVIMRVRVAEQQHNMKRLHQVQGWLSRVEDEETEIESLIKDSSKEIDKLCLVGYCSWNISSSYRYGRKVAQKLKVVSKLKQEGVFKTVAEIWLTEEGSITGERILPLIVVDERPCEPTVGLETSFDAVWRCLEEKNVGVIGIYGMGGVGKTTLLTQINNKFADSWTDKFDIVMWVVVSKDMQLEKIQETIGRKIGLSDESWRCKSLEEKAMDIYKILRRKRFVLLLDDTWERIDLIKIGVPPLSPNFTSKVVFTTRFVEVCGLMEAHKKLKVECLPDEEAWKLFQAKVGKDALESHQEIPELAKVAAKECGGLPLALITIGRAMACKKTPAEWRYAIQLLRISAHEFPGLGKEVYPLLKFSYDSLPSVTLRACLLYCCLFPQDYRIPKKHLIDCWIGEGFLRDEGGGTQCQGHHLIGILLHACLLEEEDDDFVKMHDVIHDMALWIACEVDKEKENYLVCAGTGVTEAPKVGKWLGVKRVSLMENHISSLPVMGSSSCMRLLTLFLNRNDLSSISNGFIGYMSSLRVLNLSNNDSLRELPVEVSKLVTLRHLDLSETAIKELPKEYKSLVNIKCLNLENTYYLHTIPRGLISNYSKLCALRMFNCGFLCQAKDSVLCGGSEYLVEELLGLKHIDTLSITLKSSAAFEKCLSSSKLQSAVQSLCLQYFDSSKSINVSLLTGIKSLNTLSIWNCKHLEELRIDSDGLVRMPENYALHSLVSVHIECCLRLRNVSWLTLAPNLKSIAISSCYEMEEIIDARTVVRNQNQNKNQNPFVKLQFLKLHHLHNLRSIYCGTLPFLQLKEMVVYECPLLRKLPLNSNSAKDRRIVIEGEKGWWKHLHWEDQATQNAFHLSFRSC